MTRILTTPSSPSAAAKTGRLTALRVPRDRAFAVFATATGIGLLHALDDAVLNRQPGVPIGQHLPALLVVTAAALVAVAAFPRLRTGLQAGLALVVGAVTLVNGALHVIHVSADEVSGSDVTGVLAAAAGAALVAMAGVLPFVRRGERRRRVRRRWTVRIVVAAVTAAVIVFVVLPIGVGIGQTHLFRDPVGAAPEGFQAVSFESRDGLTLSGWYLPSRNRAAVMVVSSAGGDRLGSVGHARLLAEHGYGVLVYDARGSGESEGSPNGYGWDWPADVAGALDFLQQRPDVDPDRIGGLGLSTGADVLVETAVTDRRLRAVVGDGATGRSLGDIPPGAGEMAVYMAPVFATVRLLSGTEPGPPLKELAPRVSPTPLLLIAAGPAEIEMNQVYADAARGSADLWTLPEVRHVNAIREVAEEYERRVVSHFDAALRER